MMRNKTLIFIALLTLSILLFSFIQKSGVIRKKVKDPILEKSFKLFETLKFEGKKLQFYRAKKYVGLYGDKDEVIYLYRTKHVRNGNLASFELSVKNNKFNLHFFQKFFMDSINLHFLKKKNDIDTLYYYKLNKFAGPKNFIVGKYNYYRERMKFNKKESELYYKHKDSLSRVRGNVKLFKGM